MLNGAKTLKRVGDQTLRCHLFNININNIQPVPVPPVRFLVPVPPVPVLTGASSRLPFGTAAFLFFHIFIFRAPGV